MVLLTDSINVTNSGWCSFTASVSAKMAKDDDMSGKITPTGDDFRRKMVAGNQKVSLTEKILKFLQSEVSIGDIHKVCEVREKRAALRAEGLNFFNHLISESPSAGSLMTIFSAFANSLHCLEQLGDASPHRHYLQGLDGCTVFSINKVTSNFGLLFNSFIDSMAISFSNISSVSLSKLEKNAWRDAVLAALHAIAID